MNTENITNIPMRKSIRLSNDDVSQTMRKSFSGNKDTPNNKLKNIMRR